MAVTARYDAIMMHLYTLYGVMDNCIYVYVCMYGHMCLCVLLERHQPVAKVLNVLIVFISSQEAAHDGECWWRSSVEFDGRSLLLLVKSIIYIYLCVRESEFAIKIC